jgi:hypothetical protein
MPSENHVTGMTVRIFQAKDGVSGFICRNPRLQINGVHPAVSLISIAFMQQMQLKIAKRGVSALINNHTNQVRHVQCLKNAFFQAVADKIPLIHQIFAGSANFLE